MPPTSYHRLILPGDSNHKDTLYAGSLLRLALEAGYAAAWKHVGPQANLVLRRVLNLECLRPVPVGTVIEIEGAVLHRTQVYLVTGLIGTPLEAGQGPWLEALLGFAQVDDQGRPDSLPEAPDAAEVPDTQTWRKLRQRLQKLLRLR
jgi:acyl-CoA thioesterase YciA